MKTWVIFMYMGGYCATPIDNYYARISNARLRYNLSNFDTIEEVTDYLKRYFKAETVLDYASINRP